MQSLLPLLAGHLNGSPDQAKQVHSVCGSGARPGGHHRPQLGHQQPVGRL